MDLTPMKKDNSVRMRLLSDQQIKLGNINVQTISETENSLRESYMGVLTLNQEKIKVSLRGLWAN
jgi:hypothetical protein